MIITILYAVLSTCQSVVRLVLSDTRRSLCRFAPACTQRWMTRCVSGSPARRCSSNTRLGLVNSSPATTSRYWRFPVRSWGAVWAQTPCSTSGVSLAVSRCNILFSSSAEKVQCSRIHMFKHQILLHTLSSADCAFLSPFPNWLLNVEMFYIFWVTLKMPTDVASCMKEVFTKLYSQWREANLPLWCIL